MAASEPLIINITLGLHNVMLTVFEYNLAARRAHEKARGTRSLAD